MSEAIRYQYHAIPFTNVTIDDDFWSPRIEINRTVTIGYDFQKSEETDRLTNFDKAAGRVAGDHIGIFFNDSDVFKIIEGAAYSLHIHPDPELDVYLDNLIERIGAAQEADGYLYTARTIRERNGETDKLRADLEGLMRWSHLRVNHELYNVGHLYEAAVAHYLATGKRSLLNIAIKNADLIDSVFGPDKKHDVPGHQEIEMGLVKLYNITGEKRYLQLAKFFLDERGHDEHRPLQQNFDNPGYMQDHQPVIEQDEAVGHAVRALYMYSGMADVAALTGEESYITALDRLWQNVVGKKIYITGGVGARRHGETFGDNYELPNATAYNETCAAIANVFWNQRLFQLHGAAQYIDVLERSLYNAFLPGVAFSGDKFFYVNPLSFDGEFNFNRDNSHERLGWFNCSCCPTNVVRLFPSLSGYIYAQSDAELYVNLFINSQSTIDLADTRVTIAQQSNYPWDGAIAITVQPESDVTFTLRIRIPGWAQGQPLPSDLYRYLDPSGEPIRLTLNGEPLELRIEQGYAHIKRLWRSGDVVKVQLPMPVRRVLSHPAVEGIQGKVAIERGPLVYCAEAVDNGDDLLTSTLADDATFIVTKRPALLQDIYAIQVEQPTGKPLTLIPYYAWAHRAIGPMTVWFNR